MLLARAPMLATASLLVATNTSNPFTGEATFVGGSQPILLLTSGSFQLTAGEALLSNITIALTDTSGAPIDFSQEGISASTAGTQLVSTLNSGLIEVTTPSTLTEAVALADNEEVLLTLSYYNMRDLVASGMRTVTITITDADMNVTTNTIALTIKLPSNPTLGCSQRAVDVVLVVDSSNYDASVAWVTVVNLATAILQDLPVGPQTVR